MNPNTISLPNKARPTKRMGEKPEKNTLDFKMSSQQQ
jgi:hypothetical protein